MGGINYKPGVRGNASGLALAAIGPMASTHGQFYFPPHQCVTPDETQWSGDACKGCQAPPKPPPQQAPAWVNAGIEICWLGIGPPGQIQIFGCWEAGWSVYYGTTYYNQNGPLTPPTETSPGFSIQEETLVSTVDSFGHTWSSDTIKMLSPAASGTDIAASAKLALDTAYGQLGLTPPP